MASEQKLAVDGLDYHVRDSGGPGETVLLLHGAPDDGELWRHQAAALSQAGYRVLCPDLLGYGQSAKPEELERYVFDSMRSDLLSLLDRLDVEAFHLVAHDFGAVLGWPLAAEQADRVASFAALSLGHPAPLLNASLEEIRYQWFLFFHATEGAADLYRAEDGALLREGIRRHPDPDAVLERMLEPGALEAMIDWERANAVPAGLVAGFAGLLPDSPLPPIEAPTLGVWSSGDDYLWERQMAESGAHVQGEWRYERIDGAGHWFMLERPEETNRLLLGWLHDHPGG